MLPDSSSALLRLALDQFALDMDLNLVTNQPPAIDQHIEGHAEILPVDLSLRAIGDAMAHHRVVDLSVARHGERYRLRDSLDGQVAGHGVVILPGWLDFRAFEMNRRILIGLQQIR